MTWPLFEFFRDKVAAHMEIVNDFLDPLIMNARADNLKKGKASLEAQEDTTLLGELVKTIDGMFHLPAVET